MKKVVEETVKVEEVSEKVAEAVEQKSVELNVFGDVAGQYYCSFNPQSIEGKKRLYKGMCNADHDLSNYINRSITVVDVFAETVNILDRDTGVYNIVPRIVLFDLNGESYKCTSIGVYNCLKRLFAIFGEPTWIDGLELQVLQKKTRDGLNTMLVLDF